VWISVKELFEKVRKRRTAYKSGRRELLGFETRRGMIGFEKPGERKVAPKRKRPKPSRSLIDKTPLRAKTSKSRVW